MHDNPREIAEYLIQQHGLHGALNTAIEGAVSAHDAGDFYTLSVWREIKAVIRAQLAQPETGPAHGEPTVRGARQ